MKKNLLFGLLSILSINTIAQNKKISFETSEGFTLGNMNTQQNWNNWGYVSDNNSKVINTFSSDGTNAVQVLNDDIEEGNWGGITYPITKYRKYSISADVYLEDANNSDYEMLALYNENNDFDLIGGLLFYYDGKVAYEDMDNSIPVGTWIPKKWYNVKAEVDLKAKKVIYFLDNVKVKETTISSLNNEITEVDFSFDNYGSSFIIDNVNIIDLENLGLDEYHKTETIIYPNPASHVLNINTTKKIDSVEVYDLVGKFILKADNQQSINVEHLNTGTYIIKIKTGDKIVSKKFIKK